MSSVRFFPQICSASNPDISAESSSPPWYATPDASTPGEKFFTPSLDDVRDEADRFAGEKKDDSDDDDDDAKQKQSKGEEESREDTERLSQVDKGRSSTDHRRCLGASDSVFPQETAEAKEKEASTSTTTTTSTATKLSHPDLLQPPSEGEQRPISIGQEDEFILLPAFNPDFDEIFTSLTK